METTLSLLQTDGLVSQWSDKAILPGTSISGAIDPKLSSADIIVFLISPDFIESAECNREWKRGQDLGSEDRIVFRIPIILRPCAWEDFLAADDVKALPTDGEPVSLYPDEDTAWQEVYQGIKGVVEELRNTFTPKPSFLAALRHTDFTSDTSLALDDVFTFPRLTLQPSADNADRFTQETIGSMEDLLALDRCLLYGPDKAGKTALARSLYLSLVASNQAALLIDLSALQGRLTESAIRSQYTTQFSGAYSLWKTQPQKTLILDNLTEAPHLVNDIQALAPDYSSIYITLSSDTFAAFYKDETRFAAYKPIRMEPLTHVQQEGLIRKRLGLLSKHPEITDGFVDQVESHINSIILSNHIVPRFPFFVLSILQTYESFMPRTIPITSYGHCYYVLIISSLTRAGISDKDDSVNTAFNLAEELALATYSHRTAALTTPFSFPAFLNQYRDRFIIKTSLLNRLKHPQFGILTENGTFRTDYMYYFFFGKYLASHSTENKGIIDYLCENSHEEDNYLTLLFTIHHATEDTVIDEILLGTLCALETVPPATLNRDETQRFSNLLSELPGNIMSNASVDEERKKEREIRDKSLDNKDEKEGEGEAGEESRVEELSLHVFRILKNNKIMGQVLRTRYGNLEKRRIEEIIETVVESALRVVNTVLKDEEEIGKWATYIKAQSPDADVEEVRQILRLVSFFWTIEHIEQAVAAVNVPDVGETLRAVVERKKTPAYELVGYFSQLDSAEKLSDRERDSLAELLDSHDDTFIKWVLSIRTQMYMNTHRSRARVEQSVCAALKIPYAARHLSQG